MGDHTIGPHRLFGEPTEKLCCIGRLADGIGPRFTIFQSDQMGKLFQPRGHQLPSFTQHL